MKKAEAKRYVEQNITIMFMIISSSHSYIYLLQVLHNSRVFLLLNALYTNKARFFRARSICVAKSNANRNLHGLLKYLGSINSYLKPSNAGQHRRRKKNDFIVHSRQAQWTFQVIHIINFKSWSMHNVWHPKSESGQSGQDLMCLFKFNIN